MQEAVGGGGWPELYQSYQFSISQQPLRKSMKRFRGGLVFKARRLLYHSTLGSWAIKKTKKVGGRDVANSHGTGPVYHIISTIKWIQASWLSIKNSRSGGCDLVRIADGVHLPVLDLLPGSIPAAFARAAMLWEDGFDSKLSGDEGYCRAWYWLVIVQHSCSKLHCQTVLYQNSFPVRSDDWLLNLLKRIRRFASSVLFPVLWSVRGRSYGEKVAIWNSLAMKFTARMLYYHWWIPCCVVDFIARKLQIETAHCQKVLNWKS